MLNKYKANNFMYSNKKETRKVSALKQRSEKAKNLQ